MISHLVYQRFSGQKVVVFLTRGTPIVGLIPRSTNPEYFYEASTSFGSSNSGENTTTERRVFIDAFLIHEPGKTEFTLVNGANVTAVRRVQDDG